MVMQLDVKPTPWVKICGITRAEDARAAIEMGVDALGFVFVPQSPRALMLDTARAWMEQLDTHVLRVGLFMDASSAWIESVLHAVRLDMIQFHGDETVHDCQCWGVPYIKALGSADTPDARAWLKHAEQYHSAEALLIDSHAQGQMGGSGQVGDWGWLADLKGHLPKPWILAGGLGPDNIARAIETLGPDGVDLSSGVESRPGVKDHGKIEDLMQRIVASSMKTTEF